MSKLVISGRGAMAMSLVRAAWEEGLGAVRSVRDRDYWNAREFASGHAQCVLHRGYSYLRYSDRVIEELNQSCLMWEQLIENHGLPYNEGIIRAYGVEEDWLRDYDLAVEKLSMHEELPQPVVLFPGRETNEDLAFASARYIRQDWAHDRELFACKEKVVRPSVLLNFLAKQEIERRSPIASADSILEIQACGREYFSENAWEVKSKSQVVLLIRSKILPRVNLLASAASDLSDYGYVGDDRYPWLTVVSHVDDDERTVWMVDSRTLESSNTSAKTIRIVKTMLESIFAVSDLSTCEWAAYEIEFPVLTTNPRPLEKRGIKPIDGKMLAYAERFTLTPLLAKHVLSQALDATNENEPVDQSGSFGWTADYFDRWEKPCGDVHDGSGDVCIDYLDWKSFVEEMDVK